MIKKIDYIELYVANAVQSVYFYQNALGFKLAGIKSEKINGSEIRSFLLEQGNIKFILTSTPIFNHEIANHVHIHGDSIKDIAFETEDVEKAFTKAVSNGAKPVQYPVTIKGQNGDVKRASISTFGNTIHSFIERSTKDTFFLPHFEQCNDSAIKTNLKSIDHIAIAIESDAMDIWKEFYQNIFGFYESYNQVVETNHSGMNSIVMCSKDNLIKFVFVSPLKIGKKSQISVYLSHHNSAGVQHLAFSSDDIYESVKTMKKNGLEFLSIPSDYYNDLPKRLKSFNENLQDLQDSQILLDRDEKGYLLQAFTKPVHIRPTLFYEIVQRKGAEGFGEGNVKALFEAVEKEQIKREKV